MKALAMYIFCGSMGIGAMQAGIRLDKVLEITDSMLEENSKHFIHNYPDIPVIKPSEWDNTTYKTKLFEEKYDILFGNPPCSGLSQINRHASVNNDVNKYLYKFVDMVSYIEPKTFVLENAPTLISRGKSILEYLVCVLDDYYITIVRDYAGNHKVPMKRQRTLILGYKKSEFKGIPKLKDYEDVCGNVNVLDILLDYSKKSNEELNKITNLDLIENRSCKDIEKYSEYMQPEKSIIQSLAEQPIEILEKLDLSEKRREQILKLKKKLSSGKKAFDKTPYKLSTDKVAPSMTSLSEFYHPIYDRPLAIREYAEIMGYPDSFEFVDNAKVPYVQSIAQGVPVNFAKWAFYNIKDALDGNIEYYDTHEDILYENRCNLKEIKRKFYNKDTLCYTDNIC